MESWENKILSDKLNNLQDLPAGYFPDLNSKWEIIEAGLPQQKKQIIPLLIRWSVAATIIACVAVMGIKLNQNNKTDQQMIAAVKIPSLPISVDIKKEKTAIVAKPVLVKKDLQFTHKPVPDYETKAILKQDNQQLKNDESEIDLLIPTIDSTTINTDKLATVIPQQEIPKRTKRRTYQKDFNDGLLVMDTGYSKPANPQFGFKFQLHPSAGDEVQPSRRLQLKQVL